MSSGSTMGAIHESPPPNIKRLVVSVLRSNCYLVWPKDSGTDAAVIDPGGSPKLILKEIEAHKLNVRYIFNTHNHWDHSRANAWIQAKTDAPVCSHPLDAPRGIMRAYEGIKRAAVGAKKGGYLLVNDGDVIEVSNDLKFKVIHTPGHSWGGICLLTGNVLFTGDTLFKKGIGRYDFRGGSYEDLMDSLRNKLFRLPEDTIIYPGHGSSSTIGNEKAKQNFDL